MSSKTPPFENHCCLTSDPTRSFSNFLNVSPLASHSPPRHVAKPLRPQNPQSSSPPARSPAPDQGDDPTKGHPTVANARKKKKARISASSRTSLLSATFQPSSEPERNVLSSQGCEEKPEVMDSKVALKLRVTFSWSSQKE